MIRSMKKLRAGFSRRQEHTADSLGLWRRLRRRSRAGFTLTEMVMALAILALFSILIVQMFARAHQLTEQARDLDRAVTIACDLADQWKARVRPAEAVALLEDLKVEQSSDARHILPLDAGFRPLAEGAAVHAAELTVHTDVKTGLRRLSIRIFRHPDGPSDEIYRLETARWIDMAGGQS